MEFDVTEEENVFPIVPPGENNIKAILNNKRLNPCISRSRCSDIEDKLYPHTIINQNAKIYEKLRNATLKSVISPKTH